MITTSAPAPLRTQGEIEAQIGLGFSKLYTTLFGRGFKQIQVNLLPKTALVVTQNTFTLAEQQIFRPGSLPDDNGCRLFKDMRSRIMEAYRANLNAVVESAAGVEVVEVHHDMSTETGEEVFVFSLRRTPEYRLNGGSRR